MDHKKHPIIIGAKYVNDDEEVGVLESCVLYPRIDNAEIVINTDNCGRFYRLNYDTFTYFWKLKEKP
jgi:hypothetical protein